MLILNKKLFADQIKIQAVPVVGKYTRPNK